MADIAGPSSSKKRKTEDKKQVFVDFLSKRNMCTRVSKALDDLLNGSGPIPFVACAMEILEADANLCRSFGNVHCHTQCHFDETPITASIGSIFKRGCSVLHEYLKNRKVPGEKKLQTILMKLVTFLSQQDEDMLKKKPKTLAAFEEDVQWIAEESALFEDTPGESEVDWCLRVAQHLFSQLSYLGEYTIDSGYEGSSRRKNCPCSTKDELVGKFGDTSFGCQTLWHGSADLIFGMEMPVNVVQETADMSESESSDTEPANTSQIGMEAKNTEHDFNLKDKYQMRGQVVGFGFYVHKLERQKENPKYFLIPHIGFSKRKVKFLFYDSVNDVLLETSAQDMCYYGNQLSYHIIITVWLVMNYKVFGGETPVDLRRYKSGLHNMFPSKIKVYTVDVEAPCHVKSSLQKEESLPNYCKYDTSIDAFKELQFKLLDDL